MLTATLTAGLSRIRVGSRDVLSRVFNEQYLPPTLRVRPGDVIRLKLRNRIDRTTNLHYHGLNVSPRPPSDNILLAVDPGQEFDYQIVIPPDHPPGLFWYQPHAHGLTEFRTYSGMSGGLIVDGLLDPFPALQGHHRADDTPQGSPGRGGRAARHALPAPRRRTRARWPGRCNRGARARAGPR